MKKLTFEHAEAGSQDGHQDDLGRYAFHGIAISQWRHILAILTSYQPLVRTIFHVYRIAQEKLSPYRGADWSGVQGGGQSLAADDEGDFMDEGFCIARVGGVGAELG